MGHWAAKEEVAGEGKNSALWYNSTLILHENPRIRYHPCHFLTLIHLPLHYLQ